MDMARIDRERVVRRLTVRKKSEWPHWASSPRYWKYDPKYQPAADRLLEHLEPIYAQIEQGTYLLTPVEDLDTTELEQALFHVLGPDEAGKVQLVSLRQDGPPLGRVVYFGDLMRDEDGLRRSARYRDPRWQFNDGIWNAYCETVRRALKQAVEERLRYTWRPVREGLKVVLMYYYFSAIRGSERGMGQTEPMVDILPRAIPIGRLIDDPGTWIFLGG